jgi:hypothetical protein
MNLDRAIKIQAQLKTRIRDCYSSARIFCPSSDKLNDMRQTAMIAPKGTPTHVLEYVRGYGDCLGDALYHDALVFGGYVGGVFYSTHRDRADYYETNGIEPSAYADNGLVTRRGHYWAKDTTRPFFVSDK